MIFKKLILSISMLCFPLSMFAQTFGLVSEIGNFSSARSFYFLSKDKFVVTDDLTNEVILFEDNIEKKRIGGYGWGNETFDKPINVFADPLNIWVTDYNNHRIQRYDKNLNYIGTLYTRDDNDESKRFGFPMGVVQSSQGDLFVLDSENRRVVKFNSIGDYAMNFGGFEYGRFGLDFPTDIAIDTDNNIYILDQNNIKIFNSFGTGIKIIKTVNEVVSISVSDGYLSANTPFNVFQYKLTVDNPDIEGLSFDPYPQSRISDTKGNAYFIQILTQKKIIIYKKNNIRTY